MSEIFRIFAAENLAVRNMNYEIYCDESCVEALYDKSAHKYMAIGGVWLPVECRMQMKLIVAALKKKYGRYGEMKWNKVSPATEAMYLELIDLFFQTYQIRFRAICVEAEKVDHTIFNNGNGELGFYKFYFQLVQHWLIPGNSYRLFVDHKINGNPHRVAELGRILQYASTANISMAQALPSEQSILIQLADVLTGAVAASFNGTAAGSKLAVCQRIESYIGHEVMSTGAMEQKFNVFNINLRKGW